MSTAKVAASSLCLVYALAAPVLSFGQVFTQDLLKAVTSFNADVAKVNSQVLAASPDLKEKLGDLASPIPMQPKPQIELASESDRAVLCAKVTTFVGYTESQAKQFSTLALGSIIVAAALALIGSIASFLSKNKTAGIISLTVAAIVGLSNAYPVASSAHFYTALTGQGKALIVNCELARPCTTTVYASDVSQLKLLYLTEEKKPTFGSPQLATDNLTTELQQLRTASNNVTVAQR